MSVTPGAEGCSAGAVDVGCTAGLRATLQVRRARPRDEPCRCGMVIAPPRTRQPPGPTCTCADPLTFSSVMVAVITAVPRPSAVTEARHPSG